MCSLLKCYCKRGISLGWKAINLTTEDTVSWRRVRHFHQCYRPGTWFCFQGKEEHSWISRLRSRDQFRCWDDGPPACLTPCCRAAHSRPDSRDHRPGPEHSQPPHHLAVNIIVTVVLLFPPKLLQTEGKMLKEGSWWVIFLVWRWDIVISELC